MLTATNLHDAALISAGVKPPNIPPAQCEVRVFLDSVATPISAMFLTYIQHNRSTLPTRLMFSLLNMTSISFYDVKPITMSKTVLAP